MSKVTELLTSLSQDDIKELKDFFVKLEAPQKTTRKPRKKVVKKQKKAAQKQDGLVVLNPDKDTRKRRNVQVEVEDDLENEEVVNRGSGKGAACCTRKLNVGPRKNKFLTMSESRGCKADSAIDKKLYAGRTITERSRPTPLKKARCIYCHDVYEVNVNVLPTDSETHRVKFICNNCQIERRGG